MAGKIIVLVSDRDDPKHGEITVMDDPKKAERLVETLLEAGFEQERIRIYRGGEVEMQVSHRPVVSLLLEGPEGLGTTPDSPDGHREEEPAETVEAEVGGRQTASTSADVYTQGGIRFSSLFRSA